MRNKTEYFKTQKYIKTILGDGTETSPKDERQRAQIECARLVLERSAALLITSSKAFQRHPECLSARENRDTVFCQMRRALDLVHFIVKEGVVDGSNRFGLESLDPNLVGDCTFTTDEDHDSEMISNTVLRSIKYFEDSVEMSTGISVVSDSYREQLIRSLDSIMERIQDFTDCAYTSHEHRQNIILLCDRAKMELEQLLMNTHNYNNISRAVAGMSAEANHDRTNLLEISSPTQQQTQLRQDVDQSIRQLIKTTTELRLELQQTSLELASSLIHNCWRQGGEILSLLKSCAFSGDVERLQQVQQVTKII